MKDSLCSLGEVGQLFRNLLPQILIVEYPWEGMVACSDPNMDLQHNSIQAL